MKSGRDSHLAAVSRLTDFPRTDVVYVGTVRSPASKGTISSINLPHLPKGYRSITADDIPGSKTMSLQGTRVPVLASGRVAYRGEPVALIVGSDKAKVAEAIELTRVRIDEETADFQFEVFDSSRIEQSKHFESGDVDRALAESVQIVEGDYRVGPQDHYYPEPQGAAATFDYDKLIVFCSTQWPFQVRGAVAEVLGVHLEEVVVRPTLLGPHLDGKLWYPSLLACHAALASVITGRPALLLLSRREDFLFTTKRAPTLASYKAGMDKDGRLTALDASIVIGMGAYSPFAREIVERAHLASTGAYACPNVRVTVTAVRSDLPSMGAFTGLGTTPVAFAVERLAEDCATAMDIDPSEWRNLNVVSRGELALDIPLRHGTPIDAIQSRLLASSDYPRKRSSFELIRKRRADPSTVPGFGIGLAFTAQMSPGTFGRPGSEPPAVELTLSMDSSLVIRTSMAPGTPRAADIWRQSAAQALGVRPEMVRIETMGTDKVPDAGPATLSRNVSVIGRLIVAACDGLRTRRFREALPIVVRKTHRARSSRAAPESPLDDASWGGAVVELELDPVDGHPLVRGIWLTVKAGRLLSPAEARLTLEHDAVVAMGLCLGEMLDLSAGPADKDDLRRYRLPKCKDAPRVYIDFLEDDGEPRGIGELAYALVPAAFVNALSQALDSPWNTLPVGDVSMLQGLKA